LADETKSPYHHGDLRAALLAGAPELIEEQGLDAFTLRGLARRLGVTHGAVYKHFSDKRALLAALSLRGHEDFEKALSRAVHAQKPIDRQIKAVSTTYVRWALSHSSQYQVMFGPRLNDDGRHPDLEVAIESTFQAVDGIFALEGVRRLRTRELSVALMTQLHGYCDLVRLRRIRVRDAAATERYVAKIIAPFIVGVCGEISI